MLSSMRLLTLRRPEQLPTDKSLLGLVENEVAWRLSENPCKECGRGADAHHLPATALSQLTIGLARLELARAKGVEQEREEKDLSLYALLETAAKLPTGNVTRDAIIQRIEGEIVALETAIGRLKAE
jgi:hypothetical protein